jgi:hypothetical protein
VTSRLTPCLVAALALSAAPFGVAADRATAQVAIRVARPSIEKRPFDASHPPADIAAHLGEHEALTACQFSASTTVRARLLESADTGEVVRATWMVASLEVDLRLRVTQHLPRAAPDDLRAHEDGHQRICEALLERGEPIAREMAGRRLHRRIEAVGTDLGSTEANLDEEIAREIGDEWVAEMLRLADRAHMRYDGLTDHGRTRNPSALEAASFALASVKVTDGAARPPARR